MLQLLHVPSYPPFSKLFTRDLEHPFSRPFVHPFVQLDYGKNRSNHSSIVEKTDTHTVYSFNFPGLQKDDLKIELEGGKLHLYGSANVKTDHYSEHLSYSETITIPKSITEDDIHATYNNGLLYVTIPHNGSRVENRRQITIHTGEQAITSHNI